MLRRETCKCCGRENPIGFAVPDEVWNAAVPAQYQNRALCILCFDYFATKAGIEWEKCIEFFPMSGASFARDYGQTLDEVAARVAPKVGVPTTDLEEGRVVVMAVGDLLHLVELALIGEWQAATDCLPGYEHIDEGEWRRFIDATITRLEEELQEAALSRLQQNGGASV